MAQPDLKSSFEFRGETINTEWYDVADVSELPDVKWGQVYAIGNVDGKVPVVHHEDSEVRNLPGGQFDEPGDTIERVLRREMKEELNMRVLSWRPIGYQTLSGSGNKYQLRVYAELEPIGEFEGDPGGSVVGHSLVPIEKLNSYIHYGDVGERIVGLVKNEFNISYITPSRLKATRHHQKTPFTAKKEISAGGMQKNKAKWFFLWSKRARVPAGVGAEPTRLNRHYAGNRFEIFRRR